MSNIVDSYKGTLKDLEKFKQRIMLEINELGGNDQAFKRTRVYPMAKVDPLIIEGYPVMQFGYEGMLPLYDENDYGYLRMIRNYYYRATFDAYDYSKLKIPLMKEVALVFVQYFKNKIIQDLDNRNKKYIQDAIKYTRLFGDDYWENFWNVDMAFLDEEKAHVQVYVVEQKNLPSFLNFLMKNHERLKNNINYLPTKEEYFNQFAREKENNKKM